MSDTVDSHLEAWAPLTASEYEEILKYSEEDLGDSWSPVDRLSAEDAAVALESFTAAFVRDEFVDGFLDHYWSRRQVEPGWFRSAAEIGAMSRLDRSSPRRLSRNLVIEIHFPVSDRPFAFRIEGTSCEAMRLFTLEGPALARCTSTPGIGWFENRDGVLYVLNSGHEK